MTGSSKLFSALLSFMMFTSSPTWAVEVGEPVPDFTLQTFDDKELSRSVLQGRPLMLIFWNTWCTECKKELPALNRLVQSLGPGGVPVLAVNTGLNDSEAKARAYWKKYGFVFPASFDRNFAMGSAFRVRGVPAIFLVGPDGIVRYKSPRFPEDIEERLKQLARH